MSVDLYVQGGQPLRGEVAVGGSGGAGLALLAACAATAGEVTVTGLPGVRVVMEQVQALQSLGRRAEMTGGTIRVHAGQTAGEMTPRPVAPRFPLYFAGPLLAQLGECRVPLPCTAPTGSHPVDLHVKALRALGATVEVGGGFLRAVGRSLQGCDICLDVPSFGATWTAVAAATRAAGRTRIIGASRAPEMVDAVSLLNRMGAHIVGAGSDAITVYGPTPLDGGTHEAMPDRITAALCLIVGAATGGDIAVTGAIAEHMRSVLAKLAEAGAALSVKAERIAIAGRRALHGICLRTGFYPGFPSQLQPAMCALLLGATGASIITETIYSDRMFHLAELERMGAHISRDGQTAIIRGPQRPGPARVRAQDPGSAAALLVAALMVEGDTCIEGAEALLDWFPAPGVPFMRLGARLAWSAPARVVV